MSDSLPYGHVPPPWHAFYRAMCAKGQGPLALDTVRAVANYKRPTYTVGEAICTPDGKEIGVVMAKDGTVLMHGVFSNPLMALSKPATISAISCGRRVARSWSIG